MCTTVSNVQRGIMQSLTILFVASLALTAYATPTGRIAGRIVGGNDAPDGKYPYQISIGVSGEHICGGSIISNRYILTAAHCLRNQSPSRITISVGTNQLSKANATYAAEKLIIHPRYNRLQKLNDIGLIRLAQPLTFNDKVYAIDYQKVDSGASNYTAVVSGWGYLQTGGKVPDKLQEIKLTVISLEQCKAVYPVVKTTHICTYTSQGKGVCNGDSGGPLVANNEQIGIVSFGRPCARGYPDVYTRVAPFSSWISQTAV